MVRLQPSKLSTRVRIPAGAFIYFQSRIFGRKNTIAKTKNDITKIKIIMPNTIKAKAQKGKSAEIKSLYFKGINFFPLILI